MSSREAYVHSLESFGSVDGPGVRYVIFLQGCRLRCQFCHNPDTWKTETGQRMTADELLEKALRYKGYWGEAGGITVSGGEPLLQMEFLTEFFKKAKAVGVHTCLDTAGNPFSREPEWMKQFNQLMQYTDLVMLDIKEMNPERHKVLTGQGNANILDMARYLSAMRKPMWIRHVLVPERSDFDEDLMALHDFIKELTSVEKVEVLPYHTMGIFKWENLGISYPLKGIAPPTAERVGHAEELLR